MSELKCGLGPWRCEWLWGHDTAEHRSDANPEDYFLDEPSAAEHARRQQAVADAEKLKAVRTLVGNWPYGSSYERAIGDQVAAIIDGSVTAGEQQPPTDPSPSNPMRLAEALTIVDKAFSDICVSFSTDSSDALRPTLAQLLKAHADAAAETCGKAVSDYAGLLARYRNVENAARAVLTELTEGS